MYSLLKPVVLMQQGDMEKKDNIYNSKNVNKVGICLICEVSELENFLIKKCNASLITEKYISGIVAVPIVNLLMTKQDKKDNIVFIIQNNKFQKGSNNHKACKMNINHIATNKPIINYLKETCKKEDYAKYLICIGYNFSENWKNGIIQDYQVGLTGKLRNNEGSENAIIREVKEELGMTISEKILEQMKVQEYTENNKKKTIMCFTVDAGKF